MFAPPKLPGSNMGKSVLIYDGSSSSGSANNGESNSTVLNMDLIQKQQLQKRLIMNEEESYLRERANAMQTVEQTIIELGGMFQQLATMIKEQDEAIQRIDSNIEDVDLNVSAAHTELLKYFQSITSNRWLMIKIFFVLIVFFIVFVVVMT
jgi:syntaxin 5